MSKFLSPLTRLFRRRQAAEETRSIENPAIPVTAAQLDAIAGYGPTRSGVQINEHTALTFTAVYAAIRILAEGLGMLPTAVFQGDEDEGDLRRAKSHPAYPVLRYEANPEMTASVFKETLMGHLAGWGNAYARIITDGANRPRQLLPLLPDRTHPERFAGQLRYVSGNDRFAPEEILHVPGLSFNGLKGYSPIGLAREAIAMGKAHEIFGATFFGNGANMDGVVTHPKALKPEAVNNLKESIAAHYGNVGNAHKPLILEEGATYNRISVSPQDAQYIAGRQFQVTEIARIYRIPLHMLADIDKGSRATVEQASIEFLTYTLQPWLEKFEQELNRKLFPGATDFFVRFDTRRLIRTDSAARQAYYACGRQWGFLSANDIRRMEGDAAIEGGDTYLSPVNMVPADLVNKGIGYGAPIKPSKTKAGNEPPTNDDQTGDDEEPTDDAARCAAAMRPVFTDAIRRMLRKEANATARDSFNADKFYAEHRGHVMQAIETPAAALARMLKPRSAVFDYTGLAPILQAEAARRNPAIPPDALNHTADEIAGQLVDKIVHAVQAAA